MKIIIKGRDFYVCSVAGNGFITTEKECAKYKKKSDFLLFWK
jgi:hypothetical protein